MIKKNKGFTLVELLATLGVLALIFTIIVPIVLTNIENSRKDAFKDKVLVASNVLNEYLLEGHEKKLIKSGITVQELSEFSHNDFVSGKFIEKDGQIEAYFISDGKYCAMGPISDLRISKDCYKLDNTPPIVNSDKVYLIPTSNKVDVYISEDFAFDEETEIVEYRVTISGKETQTSNEPGVITVKGLKHDTEYTVTIEAVNKNNLSTSVEKVFTTTSIETPSYLIEPNGWSTSKTVTINYPEGYTNEYSLDGGSTWKTYSKPLEFISSGTVLARVADGTTYVMGSSQTIGMIDRTAPTSAGLTYETTTKSITVTAYGIDEESDIKYYQFSSDNGSTWSDIQEAKSSGNCTNVSCTYKFDKLKTGTYNIKARVINGAYSGDKKVSSLNSKTTDTYPIKTVDLCIPSFKIIKLNSNDIVNGWSQGKRLEITCANVPELKYSTDGGTNWQTYDNPIPFTANGTLIAKVSDGINYLTSSSQTIGQIDRTTPTASSFTYITSTNSITVTAIGADDESGIGYYQFSKDGGSTWSDIQEAKSSGNCTSTSCTYKFDKLKTGTYDIKVRVINNTYANEGLVTTTGMANYKDSTSLSIQTQALCTPEYLVDPLGWSQSKTITISLPDSNCGGTLKYSTDGALNFTDYSKPLTISENVNIIARVDDGTNYKDASELTIHSIDNSAPISANVYLTERTSKEITVTASATDEESDILYYQFYDGSSWSPLQKAGSRSSCTASSCSYTFSDLQTGTYNIKARIINSTYEAMNSTNSKNMVETDAVPIQTIGIDAPTFTVTPNTGWALSKTVKINYVNDHKDYTYEYSLDGGTNWQTYDDNNPVVFTADGTIIARVNDGINYVTGSSVTIAEIYKAKAVDISYDNSLTGMNCEEVQCALDTIAEMIK